VWHFSQTVKLTRLFYPARQHHQWQCLVGGAALDWCTNYTKNFAAIESVVSWDRFESSVAEAQALAQPDDFDYLSLLEIRAHWQDILRVATSIITGTVTASIMLRKLAAYQRQNGLK
jgi:hypothetical protein